MRRVVYAQTAARQLRKLGSTEAGRIRAKIAQAASDPVSVAGSLASLKGVDAHRLRVGDWRVILRMEPDRMLILKVAHRREAYD